MAKAAGQTKLARIVAKQASISMPEAKKMVQCTLAALASLLSVGVAVSFHNFVSFRFKRVGAKNRAYCKFGQKPVMRHFPEHLKIRTVFSKGFSNLVKKIPVDSVQTRKRCTTRPTRTIVKKPSQTSPFQA